jgi:uncharacterized protein YutE (UPF0331/DUF86 family)
MADDVILNKAGVIERCLQRVEDEYEGNPANLRDDITRQDAIVLNLQRACQAAIDLAMHLVREHSLGVPQESREAFALLDDAGYLRAELSDRLQRMVGFRNVAVHDYQDLNLDIVQSIVEEHLSDFTRFTELVVTTNGFRTDS